MRNKKWNQQRVREQCLRSLGFPTYQAYLSSEMWAIIRASVLRNAGHKCVRCKKPASQVHHKRYTIEAMTGENLSLLVAVCAACHLLCEYTDDGKKCTVNRANRRLRLPLNWDEIVAAKAKRKADRKAQRQERRQERRQAAIKRWQQIPPRPTESKRSVWPELNATV